MRTYDVYSGTEGHASVCVQDDGQKVWTFTPEWKDFWVEADKQKVIEWDIDHDPNAPLLTHADFTIRLRSA